MPIQCKLYVDIIVKLFWIKYITSFRYVFICDHSSKLLMKYLVVARDVFPYFYVGLLFGVTMMYEVEYADGYKTAMTANVIASNLFSQVDQYG